MIRDNFGKLTEKRQVKRLKMEYQYTWIIENFRDLHYSYGHYDVSPTFSMGRKNEYKCTFLIYVGGYEQSDYIEILPFLLNKKLHDNAKFSIKISLLDKDDREQLTKNLMLVMGNLNESTGIIDCFLKRTDLLKNPDLLPNDELRLSFQISFDVPSTIEETTEIQYLQYYQKSQLDNFEQLYGNEEFSDFKLVFGETEFPVHQAILAARSSVFKAMFLSNMRESKEKKVPIEDVDQKIMMQVLKYIYSGKVGKIQDIADKVLPVADKYQLDALKQICEDILIEQFSIDNIYEMLQFSDNYNAKTLKVRGIDFFKKNFDDLAAADNFRSTISVLSANLKTDIICAPANIN